MYEVQVSLHGAITTTRYLDGELALKNYNILKNALQNYSEFKNLQGVISITTESGDELTLKINNMQSVSINDLAKNKPLFDAYVKFTAESDRLYEQIKGDPNVSQSTLPTSQSAV